MGKTREHRKHRHATADGDPPLPYPPSPSSTSSSDFEFTVSMSPRKAGGASLCPADELFYKGQLLPLHLSPRLSMVRSLLLASSSTSSCSDTTASRDSSGSSNDSTVSAFSAADALTLAGECDSSRPSSVTEEDATRLAAVHRLHHRHKYLASLATRFSSVFHRKKDAQQQEHTAAPTPREIGGGNDEEGVAGQGRIPSSTSGRRSTGKSGATASSAKEVFKKYVKKVKPLYEKLEKLSALQQHRNQQQQQSQKSQTAARQELRKKTFSFSVRRGDRSALDRVMRSASASRKEREVEEEEEERHGGGPPIYTHSFSGNLRFLQKRQCAAAAAAAVSCPSSMRSSPSHSGLLYPRDRGYGSGGGATSFADPPSAAALRTCRFPPSSWSSSSSMEEVQSAIQGAIAHCKSTMAAPSSPGKASIAASEQI